MPFTTYPFAPSRRASSRVRSSDRAENTTTVTAALDGVARISFSRSRPFISGIITSAMTRSGVVEVRYCSAA